MITEKETSTLEVHYEIWNDREGVKIDVGPDRDVGTYPQILTIDPKSQEHYGKIDLVLPPHLARKVGQALIRCADDCEAAEKNS